MSEAERRTWPSVEDFRRMTAVQVNAFFESVGVDWRVADFDGSIAAAETHLPRGVKHDPAECPDCARIAGIGGGTE